MAEIRPLPGVRYNFKKLPDLSQVLCPPYDIISPAQQEELYASNPYNFVRVEFGQELPQDSENDNKYLRARASLGAWLDARIMLTDSPAVYVHDQFFMHKGQELCRRGLVVRVRLEEWAKMVVRPHEGTLSAPKADRIRLLGTLAANTSSVLAMYEDAGKEIANLVAGSTRFSPVVGEALPLGGERHQLRVMSDPEAVSQLVQAFTDKPLYIADGHHRYESALTYAREQRASNLEASLDADANFVMMTLVAFDDPGLLILPPHRLLRGLPPGRLASLRQELSSFFDINTVSLESRSPWPRIDRLQAEPGPLRLVLYGLDGRRAWVLTLKDFEAAARLMPAFHTDIYKRLDVSLVDHVILEELLGLKAEGEGVVAFNYDRDDAVAKVDAGDFQLAFLVKPVRPETIKQIADAQDRMPRKSTYFYPKLPSGLVVNRLS